MKHRLQVLLNRQEVPGIHHLVFQVPEELGRQYVAAGQYVQLDCDTGRPVFMAIASAPQAAGFEFLIQVSEGTAGAICALREGDTVACSEVMGTGFPMEKAKGTQVLFFAGGTGISAVRALIESTRWEGARLYYGANRREEMAYTALFADWEWRGVRVVECIEVFPTQAYAAEGATDASSVSAVLCGPNAMMAAVTELLVAQGMPADRALKNT